jgi:hypothetical protein
MPRTLALYPFRFYDLVRRRWFRGRYVAEIHEIAERHAAFQLIGEPEIRVVPDDWRELVAGNLQKAKQ